MAIAMTALTFGTSITFAASTQLMSGNYFPTFAATNDHTHHHQNDMIADINGDNSNSTADSNGRGSFSPTEYASGNHPHHHYSSTDQNGIFSGGSDRG
jgi:hypothetical protein